MKHPTPKMTGSACIHASGHFLIPTVWLLSDDIIPVHVAWIFRCGHQFFYMGNLCPLINHLIFHGDILSDHRIGQDHAVPNDRAPGNGNATADDGILNRSFHQTPVRDKGIGDLRSIHILGRAGVCCSGINFSNRTFATL